MCAPPTVIPSYCFDPPVSYLLHPWGLAGYGVGLGHWVDGWQVSMRRVFAEGHCSRSGDAHRAAAMRWTYQNFSERSSCWTCILIFRWYLVANYAVIN